MYNTSLTYYYKCSLVPEQRSFHALGYHLRKHLTKPSLTLWWHLRWIECTCHCEGCSVERWAHLSAWNRFHSHLTITQVHPRVASSKRRAPLLHIGCQKLRTKQFSMAHRSGLGCLVVLTHTTHASLGPPGCFTLITQHPKEAKICYFLDDDPVIQYKQTKTMLTESHRTPEWSLLQSFG